jgi:hypothetical protein
MKVIIQNLSNFNLSVFLWVSLVAIHILTACKKEDGFEPNPISSFQQKTVFFTADASEKELTEKAAANVSIGDKTYYIGTNQITADNQNPIMICFDEGEKVWSFESYENAPPDGKGIGLATDGELLYAAFSVDGGTYDTPFFTEYTKNGWITSYGQGGGAKVGVILRINTDNGKPYEGSFLIARKEDGTTNSLEIRDMRVEPEVLYVKTNSWYSPLDTEKNRIQVSGSSPFDYRVNLTKDLTRAVTTEVY